MNLKLRLVDHDGVRPGETGSVRSVFNGGIDGNLGILKIAVSQLPKQTLIKVGVKPGAHRFQLQRVTLI